MKKVNVVELMKVWLDPQVLKKVEAELESVPEGCLECPYIPHDPRVLRCRNLEKNPNCPVLKEYLEYERNSLLRAGIPRRYLNAIYRKIDETEAVSYAKQAFKKILKGGLLVLAGPTGCGKTFAAVYIARAIFRTTQWHMSYIPAREISDENYRTLASVHFLIVDDVALENERFYIQYILERRYDEILPTLLTTNLPKKQFEARYGKRVASRLEEWGLYAEILQSDRRRSDFSHV